MNQFASVGYLFMQAPGKISPVLLVLLLAVLIIIVLWLALRLFSRFASPARTKAISVTEKRAVTPASAPVSSKSDDLEIIEGIGPKIAKVLCAAGVTTFAQLAAMEPAKISEVLQAGGIRLADPRSWPEQARLAAAGDTAGLRELQGHLKAGRVVS